ncbi:AraC family transcriptional regulator [Lacibacter sediminis]
MIFNSYTPAPSLQPYIEMYWQLSGFIQQKESVTLMPDGGINLLINIGEEITSTQFNKTIDHDTIYMVGPMLQTDVQLLTGKILLFGIKFRPGAFTYFHTYDSLNEVSNQFHEFTRKKFPDIKRKKTPPVTYLDQFYLDRFSASKNPLLPIVSDIIQSHGRLKIEEITKKHFITERSLERQFKQHIGITPKEFIDIERFNFAFATFQRRTGSSLLDIVWECGYYDHAHLTNDFKRYTGKPPSDFILSDLSKNSTGNLQ